MLSARLDVQTRLGQLQVQPARLDLDIQSTPAIQGSQVQVSRPSFEIFSAKAAKLEVSTRAIQSELGFRRPKQMAEEGTRLAKSEAQSAVSRITSEGDQYLNSPQNATTSIAKSVGVYKPNVQLAAIPKNRPNIAFSAPGEVSSDYQPGRVDVTDDDHEKVEEGREEHGGARVALHADQPGRALRAGSRRGGGDNGRGRGAQTRDP